MKAFFTNLKGDVLDISTYTGNDESVAYRYTYAGYPNRRGHVTHEQLANEDVVMVGDPGVLINGSIINTKYGPYMLSFENDVLVAAISIMNVPSANNNPLGSSKKEILVMMDGVIHYRVKVPFGPDKIEWTGTATHRLNGSKYHYIFEEQDTSELFPSAGESFVIRVRDAERPWSDDIILSSEEEVKDFLIDFVLK